MGGLEAECCVKSLHARMSPFRITRIAAIQPRIHVSLLWLERSTEVGSSVVRLSRELLVNLLARTADNRSRRSNHSPSCPPVVGPFDLEMGSSLMHLPQGLFVHLLANTACNASRRSNPQ